MRKQCAFCSFASEDDAVFADHTATVHGWGAPRAAAVPDAGTPLRYCYACAHANTPGALRCTACGGELHLAPSGERFGLVYLLNRLPELRERGLISEGAAATLERDIASRLHTHPPMRVAGPRPPTEIAPARVAARPLAAPSAGRGTPPRPPRPSATDRPPTPGLLSPERAPSLLLYVGAFLIVVAALIFVSVSGEQIGGGTKLVMLISGSIAFLGVGLLCYHRPRVLEAGRTFSAIGAILVPIDFGAYYLLLSGQPLSFEVVWTIGWLASAGLYAVLAATGYGRLYSYFFLAAASAAVFGFEGIFHVGFAWIALPHAALVAAIAYAATTGAPAAVHLVTDPIARASRVLASALLGLAVLAGLLEARELTAALIGTSAYHAWRGPRGNERERWVAAAAPGAAIVSLAYVAAAPEQTYGFVLALIALGYGAAGDALRLGTPIAAPRWLLERFERLAAAALVLALVPTASGYWHAPLVGSIVHLVLGAALLATGVRRQAERPLVPPLVLGGAVLLHLGALFLVLALGLIHGGAAPFAGMVGRELALAFLPLAVLLGGAWYWARAYANAPLRDNAGLAALLSAAAVVWLALGDPALATVLSGAFALAIVVAARLAGDPRLLWVAFLFAGVGGIESDRWLLPPPEMRSLSIAAAALILFVPAYLSRFASSPWARTLREIALVTGGIAVTVGVFDVIASVRPYRPWPVTLPIWLATVPSLVAFGALGVAEGLRRRSEKAILGSTAFFLAAVLMLIARVEPEPIEAYTLPTALYLAIVAWGLAHWRTRLDATLAIPARVGAALALVLPTYAFAWTDADARRAVAVLGESMLVLRFAAGRGDAALASTSVLAMAAMVVLGGADPLRLESATGLFGVIGVVLALAVPRFVSWRLPPALLALTEAASALLVLAPPLVRATARGSDSLDHGASVLALGVVLVALALWRSRRTLLATSLVTLALVGVLALPDSERAEPYVAASGVALVAMTLLVPRFLPCALPVRSLWAAQLVGAGLVYSGSAARMYADGGDAAVRVIVESLGFIAVGLLTRRAMLPYAGVAGGALVTLWIAGDLDAREFHAIALGAGTVALALVAARFTPDLLDARGLVAMETGGALLFVGPTLVNSWGDDFYPRTPFLFFEMLLLLGVGVALHRRWLVAAAIAALGLETLRALVDAVNRVPNYVLFAASGALLLGAGFVLLLKREAWRGWSHRVITWWTRL